MDQFAEYGHALVAIAIWIVAIQLLSAITGAGKASAGVAPGGTPPEDYSNKLYRMHRAYQNGIDNLTMLTAAVMIAILAGVSPFWVNLMASVALLARLVMIYVHIKGIGKPAQGVRTFIFVFHWALIVILAIMAVVAVF